MSPDIIGGMMLNVTKLTDMKYIFEPTRECFNWCKNAYDAHYNNLNTEALYLVVVPLICIIASTFNDRWVKDKYKPYLISYAKYMLMAYIFYVLFFL